MNMHMNVYLQERIKFFFMIFQVETVVEKNAFVEARMALLKPPIDINLRKVSDKSFGYSLLFYVGYTPIVDSSKSCLMGSTQSLFVI